MFAASPLRKIDKLPPQQNARLGTLPAVSLRRGSPRHRLGATALRPPGAPVHVPGHGGAESALTAPKSRLVSASFARTALFDVMCRNSKGLLKKHLHQYPVRFRSSFSAARYRSSQLGSKQLRLPPEAPSILSLIGRRHGRADASRAPVLGASSTPHYRFLRLEGRRRAEVGQLS